MFQKNDVNNNKVLKKEKFRHSLLIRPPPPPPTPFWTFLIRVFLWFSETFQAENMSRYSSRYKKPARNYEHWHVLSL